MIVRSEYQANQELGRGVTPSEAEIAQVMEYTGMGRIQAIHHLQAREQLRNQPNPFPLGKSAYDVPTQRADT